MRSQSIPRDVETDEACEPLSGAGVPRAWRDAAEEIRSHLCLLRGGGVFLSSADAWLLLRWFEAGVRTTDVLRALERAAQTRRRSRNRVPLSLVAAKRHLGKPAQGHFHRLLPELAGGGDMPLAPVLRELEQQRERERTRARELEREAVDALVQQLCLVKPGDDGLREALAAVRAFLEQVWEALGNEGRDALRAKAEAELGDLLDLIEPGVRGPLIEETARDLLRQRYPELTAATLTELLVR